MPPPDTQLPSADELQSDGEEENTYSEVASLVDSRSSADAADEPDLRLDTISPRLRHATMDRAKHVPGVRRVRGQMHLCSAFMLVAATVISPLVSF